MSAYGGILSGGVWNKMEYGVSSRMDGEASMNGKICDIYGFTRRRWEQQIRAAWGLSVD